MINKKLILSGLILIIGVYIVSAIFLQPTNNQWVSGNVTLNVSSSLPNTVNVTFYNLSSGDNILANSKIIATIANESGTAIRQFNYTWNTQSPLIAENVYLNLTAKFTNSSNSNNYTNLTNIRIDNTKPITTFLSETEGNNIFKNQNYILINTSITETNIDNITFRIFNTTGQYNLSFFTNATNQINISTTDTNEVYTYNVTITDLANQQNIIETRTLTLDTINPDVSLIYPSSTQFTSQTINFQYNASDINLANVSIFIDNILQQYNTTLRNGFISYFTNSTLADGNHKWHILATDSANNQFNASQLSFSIDTSLASGGTTTGGAGATNITQPINQTNQTTPITPTIETSNNIIQDIKEATPESIQSFLTEQKVLLLMISIALLYLGVIQRKIKKKKIMILQTILGGLLALFTIKPEVSLYLTSDLPKLLNDWIHKIFPNLTISTALIVAIFIVILIAAFVRTLKKKKS